MLRAVMAVALMLLPCYGTQLPDHLQHLAAIKRRAAEELRRQPNYTCLETIERLESPKARAPFRKLDRVRLEVSVVNGKELFAWPGAREFDETDPMRMLGGGMSGTGDFASHADSIFRGIEPTFAWRGIEDLEGRPALRFDYSVTRLNSSFRIMTAAGNARVAYHGSVWADAKTHDLLRLDTIADDIPPHLLMSRTETIIRYGRANIGGAEFLIPAFAEVTATMVPAVSSKNVITFSGCRRYTAESSLRFEEDAPPAAAVTAAAVPLELPGGLELDVSLETPIDLETGAIGDAIRAQLASPVQSDGKPLLPAGTVIHGRIRRLTRFYGDHAFTVVGLQLSEFQAGDSRGRVQGRLLRVSGSGASMTVPARTYAISGRGRPNDVVIETPMFAPLPGVGTFYVSAHNGTIRRVRMAWVTETASVK